MTKYTIADIIVGKAIWFLFSLCVLFALSLILPGCAATNFSEDVKFKPIEGRPGFIYNPDYENGYRLDDAPRPNKTK